LKLEKVVDMLQIFKTSAFNVDELVASNYLDAPFVSVAEALGSPAYRIVSVRGSVIAVSKIQLLLRFQNGGGVV